MTLEGQIALVTGATRGIGAKIAATLADAGATVIGTATSDAGSQKITAALAGHNGQGVALDVTDAEQVLAVVKSITERHGVITILVNNAGITRDGLLLRMKEDDWDALLNTNLTAIYRTSRACLRNMMKARHGRIINIGSVVGTMGNAGQTNYAAAKAGMIGFTRSLAREVGSRGITVNTVAPGFIETDMTRGMSAAQQETLSTQIPLGRLGQPADIAQAVLFLASAAGAYITGETLNVNGGMYMS